MPTVFLTNISQTTVFYGDGNEGPKAQRLNRQLSSRGDGSWEEKRMSERGLLRGWVAKSTSRGRAAHTMCQLATGTLSRAALTRVFQLGGAEAAWGQLLGLRRLTTLPLDQ